MCEFSDQQTSPQFKEQLVRHLQDHRILAAIVNVYKNWLEPTAFIHDDGIAQTNSQCQSQEKPKRIIFEMEILQNQRIHNVHLKMDSMPSGVNRNLYQ